ncbi:MAG: MogA/MoaB family molybdenum cofactor biosynthesis protein [Nitrospirales bacterium]|nr:MogA/MoaB family molybdenum cofactor biosynthesis protein [Nitrospira sp.]MDR4502559.1 MogA/MoaB family molybdenum cofactor biosynthesis protein [Nitrospirales bacterium]
MSGHHHPHTSSTTAPSHVQHKESGPKAIGCMVVTCSDTRTPETDTSGQLIQHLLKQRHHEVHVYEIIKDEPVEVQRLLKEAGENEAIETIIINGGTGISRRDATFEAVAGLLEKRLDGFGEIFRHLSYKEIGSPAMLSRAVAGLYRGRVIFSIPGSRGAVQLAMEELILPEMGHIVGEMRK